METSKRGLMRRGVLPFIFGLLVGFIVPVLSFWGLCAKVRPRS